MDDPPNTVKSDSGTWTMQQSCMAVEAAYSLGEKKERNWQKWHSAERTSDSCVSAPGSRANQALTLIEIEAAQDQ